MEILLFKGDYNIEEVFVLSLRLALGKINISNKKGKVRFYRVKLALEELIARLYNFACR